MKFLIFNVAVAAALVFLFTADRGEVQRVAGQVHDAVDGVKDYARKALDDGKTVLGKTVVARPTKPVAPSPVEKKAEVQPVSPEPARAVPQGQSAPPQSPAPRPVAVAKAPPVAVTSPAAPPRLDPAVAQRRKEVMAGIASVAPAPALKEGTRLMSAADRRKELLSLAEEMELLYARSVGR